MAGLVRQRASAPRQIVRPATERACQLLPRTRQSAQFAPLYPHLDRFARIAATSNPDGTFTPRLHELLA
jgi:hypothetical protein